MSGSAAPKLLIIEDDPVYRDAVHAMAQGMGIRRIAQASDGVEALGLARRLAPDLILCDVHMKPMGGIAFVKNLRSSPEMQDNWVPVVFLSSDPEEKTVGSAFDLMADGYLKKPVMKDDLRAEFVRVLGYDWEG